MGRERRTKRNVEKGRATEGIFGGMLIGRGDED